MTNRKWTTQRPKWSYAQGEVGFVKLKSDRFNRTFAINVVGGKLYSPNASGPIPVEKVKYWSTDDQTSGIGNKEN